MNITIDNLQYAEFASEETYCFKADVLLDGKKIGTADNAGRGGPNSYWFDDGSGRKSYEIEKWLNDQVAEPVTGTWPDGTPYSLTKDLDWVITDLVTDQLEKEVI